MLMQMAVIGAVLTYKMSPEVTLSKGECRWIVSIANGGTNSNMINLVFGPRAQPTQGEQYVYTRTAASFLAQLSDKACKDVSYLPFLYTIYSPG